MNNTNTFKVFFGFIICISVFVFFYAFSQNDSVVSAQNAYKKIPTPTSHPTSVPNFIEQKIQPYANAEIAYQRVNDVEMVATNFRIENGEFMVDTCFQAPDNSDWAYYQVKARFGSIELVPYGGTTFEKTYTVLTGERYFITNIGNPRVVTKQSIPVDGTPDYRCDTLLFHLPIDVSLPSDNVVLTVYEIGAIPTKGGCETIVQNILDAKELNIRISCNYTEGGTEKHILEKPQDMSEEQANQHIHEAFVQAFRKQGPWVFHGRVVTVESP